MADINMCKRKGTTTTSNVEGRAEIVSIESDTIMKLTTITGIQEVKKQQKRHLKEYRIRNGTGTAASKRSLLLPDIAFLGPVFDQA